MAGASVRLPTLHKDGIPTAHRTVADRIRKAILAGELPGGTRLVQAELAQSLAVSVTPVREALRDLIAEGLVDFDAFRGATVHPTTLEELEEIYDLRKTLVPIAVRAGVKEITPAELDEAAALARAMKTEPDPAEWIALNRRFHSVLDTASRRPRLQEILTRLADLSALYVGVTISGVKGRRARADKDHTAMIAAYRDGDSQRAVDLALAHLEDTVGVARDAFVKAARR
jgi:DNA-binding GntR family transcriptional regulator